MKMKQHGAHVRQFIAKGHNLHVATGGCDMIDSSLLANLPTVDMTHAGHLAVGLGIDQSGYTVAKLGTDIGHIHTSILHHIVQHGCCHQLLIVGNGSNDGHRFERMGNVRNFGTLAHHTRMGLGGKTNGTIHKVGVNRLLFLIVWFQISQVRLQVVVYQSVGGHHTVALGEIGLAIIVSHGATSLFHDECTCHKVPLSDILFGITVVSASSHIAQGHGSRTTHADTANMTIELIDQSLDDGLIGIAVIRQLQAEQSVGNFLSTYAQQVAIHIGAPTLPGIVTLVAAHLVNHTQQHLTALQQGNAHGIRGILMNEIGGTIKRIYHP